MLLCKCFAAHGIDGRKDLLAHLLHCIVDLFPVSWWMYLYLSGLIHNLLSRLSLGLFGLSPGCTVGCFARRCSDASGCG